ncbi:MAG TPA: amphi-Trp domain-containing protein [Nannocystis exedens]|nr:amphi-Trp domain-containing protein [Nannocystis exedens]
MPVASGTGHRWSFAAATTGVARSTLLGPPGVCMASDNQEFRHESLEDRQSIAKYLNALSEAFANGNLTFGHNGQAIELEPRGLLKFDVKASRKRGAVKVSLRLAWQEDEEDRDPSIGSLVIKTSSEGGAA